MQKKIPIIVLFVFSLIVIAVASKLISNNSNTSLKAYTTTLFSPEDVYMNSTALLQIDSIINAGIKAKVFPGCQVFIMKDGKPIYDKCYGYYTYDNIRKVTSNTLYDIASVSKTTGTLLAIMKLYDTGKLKLTDKASDYLIFLKGTTKENLTIKELLFHETGLPASLPFYSLVIQNKNNSVDSVSDIQSGSASIKFKRDWVSRTPNNEFTLHICDSVYVSNRFRESAMQMIAKCPLNAKTYLYSCVNFIILKEIAETISEMPLDAFLDNIFFSPLKLANMTYLPLRTHKKEDIAPTVKKDFLRAGELQGFVHDPDAAFFGGVAGNAGLFATSHDVAVVHQMLLNNGEYEGKQYLSAETCKLFTTTSSASNRRYLGFDKACPATPNHNPCNKSVPEGVYGHTGYTGTCCWVDPTNKLIFVFLSNRTYPIDGYNKLAKSGIRGKIQEVLYESLK